ncbi:MAG: glycosyl hydrolase [Betaproteobacteria bacterium RIFCSPLOWO2_12_FULL_67_28]|nr:MAG: glycosyl hydrolase [Betaproteobacteria bacterium RIFCSPLOWO2_12_FULL_67_28]
MHHWKGARILALAIAAASAAAGALAQPAVTLTHIHGLAYSADGGKLMLPSHHGLAVYRNDKWSKAPGPQHDYMGFSATAKHLYSSGHPAPGSGWINPFGVIRSKDGGRTWDKLGLEGETDFHLLATSWNTNAIYVWNPEPSSRMKQSGLHYTLNDGFAWKHAAAKGLAGEPRALAVHPDEPAVVAIATTRGVFLSRDSGENFKPRAEGLESFSVFFDLSGKRLWYGAFDDRARLAQVSLGGGVATEIELPPLTRDAVAYIAQNPGKREEYAIATFGRNVFLSRDGARSWNPIAKRGEGK